ncbi:hypothetical protein Tco_0967579 [Tanacetum coccineum]
MKSRFDTSAGNPVKEILLKLNLPDRKSILKDSKIYIDGMSFLIIGLTALLSFDYCLACVLAAEVFTSRKDLPYTRKFQAAPQMCRDLDSSLPHSKSIFAIAMIARNMHGRRDFKNLRKKRSDSAWGTQRSASPKVRMVFTGFSSKQFAEEKERKESSGLTFLLMAIPKDHIRFFMAWMMPKRFWASIKTSLEKGMIGCPKNSYHQLDALVLARRHEWMENEEALIEEKLNVSIATNMGIFARECKFKGSQTEGSRQKQQWSSFKHRVRTGKRSYEDIDESNANSCVNSTCQSNDSDGEQGTVSDNSVNASEQDNRSDSLTLFLSDIRTELIKGMERELGAGYSFDKAKQHVNSGSMYVNSGTQNKSGGSRVNTGKQNVNSGRVHVNTARVNRPVLSNQTSQANLGSAVIPQQIPQGRPKPLWKAIGFIKKELFSKEGSVTLEKSVMVSISGKGVREAHRPPCDHEEEVISDADDVKCLNKDL